MTFIVISLSNYCIVVLLIFTPSKSSPQRSTSSYCIIIPVFLHRINSHDNHRRLVKLLLSCKPPHDFHQRLVEFYTPLNNHFELDLCANPIQSIQSPSCIKYLTRHCCTHILIVLSMTGPAILPSYPSPHAKNSPLPPLTN